MSDLVFDLQRFAVVTANEDGTFVEVKAYTSAAESGAYYFDEAANYSIGSTFEGDVTVDNRSFEEVEDTVNSITYYVLNSSVAEISLPTSGGAGAITAGTGVGTSADEPAAIGNLGSATLTFDGNTIAFTNAGSDAVVNVAGGKLSYIEGLAGSFDITAATGAQIYVEGTDAENLVNIDKPFTYTGGEAPIITVNETGANVAAFDGAELINAPSGAGTITIGGAALSYNTAASPNISVDSETGSVTGFALNATGDLVSVPDTLARSEDFSVYDGDNEPSDALPTVGGYTVEKQESGYFANGLASVVTVEGDSLYRISNTSGSVGLLLNSEPELAGIVLSTGDSLVAAESDGELSGIGGTGIGLYAGSASSSIPVDLSSTSNPKLTVVKTEDGLTVDGLQAGDYEDVVVFGETVTVTAGTDDATNASGAASISDAGQVGVSITKGSFQLAGAGEVPVVISDAVTIQATNSDSEEGVTITGGAEGVVAGVLDGATITTFLGATNSVTTADDAATINVAGNNYVSDENESTNNVLVVNADGSVDMSASSGFSEEGDADSDADDTDADDTDADDTDADDTDADDTDADDTDADDTDADDTDADDTDADDTDADDTDADDTDADDTDADDTDADDTDADDTDADDTDADDTDEDDTDEDDTSDDTDEDDADDTSDDTDDTDADDTDDTDADDTDDTDADDTDDTDEDDTDEDDTSDDTDEDDTEIWQPELLNESVTEIQTALAADSIRTVSSGEPYKVDNDNGNNLVYVPSVSSGAMSITLGKGGDAVVVDATRSQATSVSVVGGAGNDSLVVRNTAPVNFDMSKGGADKIYLASDQAKVNVSLKGYNASNNGGVAIGAASTEAILGAIREEVIAFDSGQMIINNTNGTTNKANVTFEGNTNDSGQTIVNLFDSTGDSLKVGFTHADGGQITANTSDNYVLVGNFFDKKYGGSTLTGGKGNDTILAGEGDVVNAGAGKDNRIILQDSSSRGGAEVVVNAGTTLIQNAKNGYEDGDVINVDLDNVNLSSADGNLVISASGVHATVENVAQDGIVKQLIKNEGITYNAAIAATGTAISVGSSDEDVANYYQAETVDFTGYEGTLKADLSGTTLSSIDGGLALFNNVKTLYAGSGNTEFRGGASNDTLYAGTGTTSLYGAGGKNILANASEGVEKDGATSFYVLSVADGARNTIRNFEFLQTGDDDNAGTADKIEIATQDGNIVSNAFIRNGGVVIEVSRGGKSETAFIENAVGKDMKFGDSVVAQVNTNSLTYDGAANFFIATEKNAQISINSSVSGAASIWLGNSNFVGNIRTIDATNSSVRAELAGNDLDNVISAGLGDTSLWGGNGGDDFMQGGIGKNTFFYSNGNGDDTITGVNEGDVIYLSEVTLDNLSSTAVENGTAVINFKDGGKLTVNDAANANFVMAQGDQQQIYVVNETGFVGKA